MTRHRTTRIKPATRNALMDQLALAADEIVRLRIVNDRLEGEVSLLEMHARRDWLQLQSEITRLKSRRWWQVWK